jgi:PspAA-like protein
VIVRISDEDQYELADDLHAKLNELDDATVAAVDAGDEAAYKSAFEALLTFVRTEGTVVGDDDLRGSDVILPPADLSFEEAGEDFTGEGLVPDPA